MPKKTKKQKLLAELHRKISVVSSYTPQFVKTQNKTTASTVLQNNLSQYSYDNRAVTTTKTLKSDLDYSYIKTDMYCVKCRAKREDPNATKVTMKNGKPAMKGKCPTCGTGMYKIGG